ncbi:DUF4189 domain-containing protein [Rhizobium sp. KVB221]|uniref:DUF4189 domain-containing protein n=1 Tax=Rhizobium setariae TaxID=2801340 RepID=A0A936YT27_9HYPH|nr:DUF4189 domain-containing protein [Rhizobium setariae]MBL0374372.1 DUF4189 domain-containing protein [Rhizobium setariae]
MNSLGKLLLATSLGAVLLCEPVAALAQELYGSIAYSQQTRAYGWSIDNASQADAENSAMNECYKRASDCKVAMSFRNACGAVATGEDGGWGSDWGRNYSAAQNKAMHICDGYSYNCKVVVTQCVTGAQ